ncbi:hypothetical protein PMIN03_007256 [Paraphaeosphaeria minitans]
MKKKSIRNLKFLSKAKSKTWAPPQSQSQPDAAEPQDTGHLGPERQPELLALRYEESALPTEEPVEPKNPYVYHRVATSPLPAPAPAPAAEEKGMEEESVTQDGSAVKLPKSPSVVSMLKSPLPGRMNSLKKMTTFLRLKKAKTELIATSPSLGQITEPADDETHDFTPTIESGSSTVAQTLPISPTSSMLTPHTATFTSASLDLSTPLTLFPPIGASLDTNEGQEEEEEAQITSAREEIRALKLADVASTRNALHLAYTARETGLSTASRLHAQNERLAHADIAIHAAGVQNRIASQQIRTLKKAQRFLPAAENPFTAERRSRLGDEAAVAARRMEREERDALRRARWEEAFRRRVTVTVAVPAEDGKPARLVERVEYHFEPDSEDDVFEEEIEGNLDRLAEVGLQLREVAVEMERAAEEGNRRLGGMRERTDGVDDGVVRNRYALGRIH